MNNFKKNADLHYLTSIWSMPLNLYQVLLLCVDGPGKSLVKSEYDETSKI